MIVLPTRTTQIQTSIQYKIAWQIKGEKNCLGFCPTVLKLAVEFCTSGYIFTRFSPWGFVLLPFYPIS